MHEFAYHDQLMGLDPSTTMNYNINELMKSIVENLDKIALAVMGKRVDGAHFVSVHPDDSKRLIRHGSMTKVAHIGTEHAHKDTYLWVMIDKIEAAYRARFFTPGCVSSIEEGDVTPREDYYRAQREQTEKTSQLLTKMVRESYGRGIRMGIALSILVISLIMFAAYFVF